MNSTGSSSSGTLSYLKSKMKMGQVSKKLPPMTVPPELLAYEQAKLAAESLKVDQHVDDLLELFENPNWKTREESHLPCASGIGICICA